MSTPRPDRLVGKTVAGRYQVLRVVARGGMGTIYEVQHVSLNKRFALKTLSAQLADEPEALARFRREANVVAGFRHRHIVEIVDWEALDDGTPCMVMEYLEGEDLQQRLERGGPLSWPDVARFGDQVLSALATAHRAGIVHRDLKPQNVFLARDDSGEVQAKLLDFGVSKIRGNDALITGDDRLLGTPAYMSPEQADGRADLIEPATDVWAMGAILFEMATGKPAFGAGSAPTIMYRICKGEMDPLRPLRPDAPAEFETLVSDALSRDPARRLQSAPVLRERLRAALAPPGSELAVSLRRPSISEFNQDPTLPPSIDDGDVTAQQLILPPVELPTDKMTIDETMDEAAPPPRPVPTTLGLGAGERRSSTAIRAPVTRRTLRLAAIGAGAGLTVLALILVLSGGQGGKRPAAQAQAGADAAPRAVEPTVVPVNVQVADAAPAPDATPPPPPPPERQVQRARVVIETSPPHALVYEGRRPLGRAPKTLPVTIGKPRMIRVSAPGYQPAERTIDGLSPRVHVTLKKKPPPRQEKPPLLDP